LPSIVIPAHNEAGAIERILGALAPLAGDTEVVVVCNGCTDDTAERARLAAPWAKVAELAEASKPQALNAGDIAASSFPRAYLDADSDISADAIRALFSALTGDTLATAATLVHDLSESSPVVRWHYAIWSRMAANNDGLNGTSAMAVSAAGRARFSSWPLLIGDDYFLDGQFSAAEKRRVPTATVVHRAPRRLRDCVSRKARVHQGNVDVRVSGLRETHSGGGLGGALAVVRENPALAVYLPAHILVTVAARLLARWRRWRGTGQNWYRDDGRVAA
jgi:glycosyltransferase involved in cell wall biosynthesis